MFAYTVVMRIGGFRKEPDWIRLGPCLLIGACVILAVRTAKWAARSGGTQSQTDLDVEVDNAILLADTVLGRLLRRKASLFPWKEVPWHVADDEDVVK
ncbi:MAG TPA: hypothetical protein VGD59_00560 [Acidisarcina sp.]